MEDLIELVQLNQIKEINQLINLIEKKDRELDSLMGQSKNVVDNATGILVSTNSWELIDYLRII